MDIDIQPEAIPIISHKRVAKNAAIYFAAQAVSWLVTLVNIIVVPRKLGELGMGQFTFVTGVFTPFVFIHFGIEQYMIKEIGRDNSTARRLLPAALGLRLVLSPVYLFLTIGWLYLHHKSNGVWIMGIIYCIMGIGVFIGDPVRSVLAGFEDAKKVALIDLLIGSSVLLAIPFLRFGPIALIVAILVTVYITVIMRIYWVRNLIDIWISPRDWMKLIKGGMPFIINVWLLQMYIYSGIIILNLYADDKAVGIWGTAQKLYSPFMSIPTAIGFALLPSLARLADQDMKEFRIMQYRVLSLLIILGLPFSVGVILLAPDICHALYPNQFAGLALTLQLFALVTIPVYIVSTMYQFLVAQNRNAIWSIFLVGSVALFTVANVILVPLTIRWWHNASAGTAIALAIAETCSAIAALILLRSNPFTWELARRVGGAIAATAAMGVVIWLAGMIHIGGDRIGEAIRIIMLAALGTITFVTFAWQLRILTSDERAKLTALIKRKLLRRNV